MKQHVNTGDVGRGINMLSFSQYNTLAHCSDNSILHVLCMYYCTSYYPEGTTVPGTT